MENQSNTNQEPKKSNKKTIIITIVIVFGILLLFQVIGYFLSQPVNKAGDSIDGKYQINFNNNYNGYVSIDGDYKGKTINLDSVKTARVSSGLYNSLGNNGIDEFVLKICQTCDYGGCDRDKCDIVKYSAQRVGSSNNVIVKEVGCPYCKKDLNVVNSVEWIMMN